MVTQTITKPIKSRKLYADILRVIAMIAIISLHSTAPLLHEFGKVPLSWWLTGTIINSACRWGTLVFLMLSGIFMLDPNRTSSISSFLFGRFKRIIVPFITWSIIYLLIINLRYILAHKSIPLTDMLYTFFTAEAYPHLWFIYMISGLYFITPLLKVYVAHASQHNLHYFFGYWLVANTLLSFTPYFLGITLSISPYLDMVGYVGIYVAGYYLDRAPVIPYKKAIYTLAIFSFLATIFGTYILTSQQQQFDNFFFYRLNPNIVFMALGIFVYFKEGINWEKVRTTISESKYRLLVTFSLYSYGIYLAHGLFLILFRQGYLGLQISQTSLLGHPISPIVGIPLLAFMVLSACFLLIALVRKHSFTKALLS